MSNSMSGTLAEYIEGVTFTSLPSEIVDAAKITFLDWLGNVIVGSHMAPAQMTKRLVLSQGGGKESTVIGAVGSTNQLLSVLGSNRKRSTALWAAFANGVSSHIIELDDVHKASIIHAGTAVIPTALALAEKLHASGRELIEAIVVGFDICIRIGEAVTPSHYQYFHTTGTVGTFGAAAAAAKLLKLSTNETMHALGSAGTQAAALWEFIETGAMSKHLHSGKAGFNGLLAALLAREGFTGAPQILEGKRGFMNAMAAQYDATLVLDQLGTRYTILENCFKIHSSCRHTHHAIDMVIQLVTEHDIQPEDIEEINVGTYQVALDITDSRDPQTVYEGKFSIQYCAALAAVKRKAGLTEFTDENITDEVVHGVLHRVNAYVDSQCEANYPGKWGARVEIVTTTGQRYEAQTDYPKGDFENPVTSEELIEKFTSLVKKYIDDETRETLIQRSMAMENFSDIARFFG